MNNFSNKYVVVLGAANLDINFFSKNTIVKKDSNPGNISISPGGVGRNIAENIVKLGNKCHLISVFGNDFVGEYLKNDCYKKGIKIENSIFLDSENISSYISINNIEGDMQYAFNDTNIIREISIIHLKKLEALFSSCSAIVIEANLSDEILKFIIKNYNKIPIFVDTVSMFKAKRILPYLKLIHMLKPNLSEAKLLAGLDSKNKIQISDLSDKLKSLGSKRLFISAGNKTAYYSDNQNSKKYFPPKVKVSNVSGAGDAIIAAMVHGLLNNWDWDFTNKFALSISALNLQSNKTVAQSITEKKIKQFVKENRFD